CAPESLRIGSFSHASDVWMFGVTMWEMFTYSNAFVATLGMCVSTHTLFFTPMTHSSDITTNMPSLVQILCRVEQDGERLEKPPDCPQELYAVMRKCWAVNPNDRPNFAALTTMLAEVSSFNWSQLEMTEWRGQNQTTLAIGWFPASLTVPTTTSSSTVPNPAAGVPFISRPLKGSLQHTGHGDVHPDRSWGTPERLEESVILLLHSPFHLTMKKFSSFTIFIMSYNCWMWREVSEKCITLFPHICPHVLAKLK
ncbi:hypothetical protein XENOCAPTIV_000404, partial [Xenoophorus captivus]